MAVTIELLRRGADPAAGSPLARRTVTTSADWAPLHGLPTLPSTGAILLASSEDEAFRIAISPADDREAPHAGILVNAEGPVLRANLIGPGFRVWLRSA